MELYTSRQRIRKNINFSLWLISPAWSFATAGIFWNLLRCSFSDLFARLRRQNRNSICRRACDGTTGSRGMDARGMFLHRAITTSEGEVRRVSLDWFESFPKDFSHLLSVARRALVTRREWGAKWGEGQFVRCFYFFLGRGCCWGRKFSRRWCRVPMLHRWLLLENWWLWSFDRGRLPFLPAPRYSPGTLFSSGIHQVLRGSVWSFIYP